MYLKNLESLKEYIDKTEINSDEKLMIMVGDKSGTDVNSMIGFLNDKNIEFFGGIYPGLLVGSRNKREGFIINRVKPVYQSLVLPFMMKLTIDTKDLKGCTAIVMVDGLSSRMKDLTDTVYGKLGGNVKYLGGGAGYYNLEHRPCIFNNKGIFIDALYICVLKTDCMTAVEHGWKKLRGPFTVSRSEDNVLSELDNENALDIYKQVIEEEENLVLFKEDFFMFAKDHPFGILQEDGRVIVRDPISINDNDEIVCVADIPEGSQVYILKGDKDTLLNSSMTIAEFCSHNAPENYSPMVFDCISRAMFLDSYFEEELTNIQSKLEYSLEGALSIGEIASKRNGELVIHNKSTVLALLQKTTDFK